MKKIEMIKFVFSRVLKNKLLLVISFIALVLVSSLQFAIPQITQYIIDVVMVKDKIELLYLPLILLMLVAVFLAVLNFVSIYFVTIVSQKAIVNLRVDLLKQIFKQDYDFFETKKTGDLMTRFSDDIKTIQELISPNTLKLVGNIITFVFIIVYMSIYALKLTILIALTFPLLFVLNRVFSGLIKQAYRKVRDTTSLMNNRLQTSLTSILLIKSFGSESFETDKFRKLNEDNCDNLIGAVRLQSIFSPSVDLINYLGMTIVLGYGTIMVMNKQLSVGEVVAYLTYLKLLQSPMRDFSLMINRLHQAVVSYERISEIYEIEPSIIDVDNALRLQEVNDGVLVKNAEFGYSKNRNILNSISFEMKMNKTTALVGLSGSGKTTTTKLLMRLYDLDKGSITINGVDIKEYSVESLRGNIGIVTQDVELIDGTIMENIIYGNEDVSYEQVVKAAKNASILDFINSLEDGFESQVGQRGIKLSGGQKQRIAIARVFLKSPQILILDEATASLDNESEKYIQDALDSLMKKCTTLVIAHRLTTIQNADNILVMEDGSIIESGTHSDLFKKSSRYKELYQASFS